MSRGESERRSMRTFWWNPTWDRSTLSRLSLTRELRMMSCSRSARQIARPLARQRKSLHHRLSDRLEQKCRPQHPSPTRQTTSVERESSQCSMVDNSTALPRALERTRRAEGTRTLDDDNEIDLVSSRICTTLCCPFHPARASTQSTNYKAELTRCMPLFLQSMPLVSSAPNPASSCPPW